MDINIVLYKNTDSQRNKSRMPKPGKGKIFTRRATFENFLKPSAALIGRTKKKRSARFSDVLFSTENQ